MEYQRDLFEPRPKREPWNKGRLIGAKPPLRPKHVWSIRTKLQVEGRSEYAHYGPDGTSRVNDKAMTCF
jgi:hypothetical protein